MKSIIIPSSSSQTTTFWHSMDPNAEEDVWLLPGENDNNIFGPDLPCWRVCQRLPNALTRSQKEKTQHLLQVLNDALLLVENDENNGPRVM